MKLAEACQLKIIEKPFTIEQAQNAQEAFITSASMFVMPVVSIDGKDVADGKPGELTRRLRELYIEIAHQAGDFDDVEAVNA